MTTWSIPYVDVDPTFWQEVHRRFGGVVREVYFPVPGRQFASGRGPQPEHHLKAALRNAPLARSVVVNPVVLVEPVEVFAPKVVQVLRRLQDDWGVGSVTVANLALARAIKDALPELCVSASTLMGISSPAQALVAGDCVDAITVDNRLIRSLPALKKLRAACRGELRLIVNEGCLPGCLFRTQHFYEMGYYSDGYPQSLCQDLLAERPWLRLTGAWILPRHLHWYEGLYDGLKLAGRVTLRDPDRYLSVLEAYVQRAPILPRDIGGGPASPLAAIEVSDDWYEFVLHCDKRCDACTVCREQYESACVRAGGRIEPRG